MCGIAVLYNSNSCSLEHIKKMTDIIEHRGPDGEGHAGFFESCLWLGHRRLAIVDLSDSGLQPMSYCNQRYWITFNGEIYNYIELREELSRLGHSFITNTDTEVILAAYSQWGEQCLHRFNGMWAFVILDVVTKKLFLARDRFGVKPLYYSLDPRSFGISSEIKQLLSVGFGTGRAERNEVSKFLLYGEVNINQETLFEGIKQLQPGRSMTISIDNKSYHATVQQFYNPEFNMSMDNGLNWEAYQEPFSWLLEDSIRLRMRSDVPVGSCLSGGLDSSSIVVTVSKKLEEIEGAMKQKTFTSCFDDKRYDEWEYAEIISKTSNSESFRIFPEMDRLLEELSLLIWHQEEPFRSSSIFAQWNVMKLANQNGIKVLLDGQGADEVMAGYHHYIPLYLANLFKSNGISKFISSIHEMKSTGILGATESIYTCLVKSVYYLTGIDKLKPIQMKVLMKKQFQQIKGQKLSSSFQRRLYEDIFGSLQSLLRHEDRNSMAFSIEARTPFLDYRLVEHMLSMPGHYKIRDGWTKPLLRNAMNRNMPDEVRLRTDKKGFVTPENIWFENNAERIENLLLAEDSNINIWVDKATLIRHMKQKRVNQKILWRLLIVDAWLRRFQLS